MPVTEAQKRATAKYEKENYDKVLVRFPKGTKERIQNTGAKSVNNYIIQCVLNALKTPQNVQPQPISQEADQLPRTQVEEPKKVYKEPTPEELQELQALVEEMRAKQETPTKDTTEKEKTRIKSILNAESLERMEEDNNNN